MTMPAATRRPLVTSLRPAAGDPEAPLARRSPYSKWRAGTLILVYVLMVVHIVHWQLAGQTLAPLELHEVMYTAELGIVTAGFLFMALSIVFTGVVGRFFCGWGCHLMALQDLCAWLLAKVGVRRKPIRARIIAWAPFLVMAYMFVLPQIVRVAGGRPYPGFRFADDSEPIASFLDLQLLAQPARSVDRRRHVPGLRLPGDLRTRLARLLHLRLPLWRRVPLHGSAGAWQDPPHRHLRAVRHVHQGLHVGHPGA